ncbi:hypothetical protein DFJ58DRAFT_245729 [Suillus subalutaceus]|uniref:uncharacterized protein n=1 Tax=Suillus subalutaceus TaxID=48586 RepID=UPI001B8653AA|nr:uncharacterized protein DFJ58DRAFT_245729 [Suillus subalutaceus]KAG1861746.1 hypothetical protein DFJ58DRAFT_245729 [Suillus subalutaceus]
MIPSFTAGVPAFQSTNDACAVACGNPSPMGSRHSLRRPRTNLRRNICRYFCWCCSLTFCAPCSYGRIRTLPLVIRSTAMYFILRFFIFCMIIFPKRAVTHFISSFVISMWYLPHFPTLFLLAYFLSQIYGC